MNKAIILLLALIIITPFVMGATADYNAYWSFETDASNYNHTGYDGTVTSAVHEVDAIYGGRYQFDIGSQYITFPAVQIIPDGLNPFSFSFISQINSTIAGGYYILMIFDQTPQFIAYLSNPVGSVNAQMRVGFRGTTTAAEFNIDNTFYETDINKTFAHYYIEYTGGAKTICGSYKLIINNVSQTCSGTVTVGSPGTANRIASDNTPSGGEIIGAFSRIIQYNRTLTADEIELLYDNDNDPFVSPPVPPVTPDGLRNLYLGGLLAHYTFDEVDPVAEFYESLYNNSVQQLNSSPNPPYHISDSVLNGSQYFNNDPWDCGASCVRLKTAGFEMHQDDILNFWIKAPTQTGLGTIYNHRDASSDQQRWELYADPSDSLILNVAGLTPTTCQTNISIPEIFNKEWWNMVTIFNYYNGGSSYQTQLYLNGTLYDTYSFTCAGGRTNVDWQSAVGASSKDANEFGFNGSLDELSVWDGDYEFSNLTITALFNNGLGLRPSDVGVYNWTYSGNASHDGLNKVENLSVSINYVCSYPHDINFTILLNGTENTTYYDNCTGFTENTVIDYVFLDSELYNLSLKYNTSYDPMNITGEINNSDVLFFSDLDTPNISLTYNFSTGFGSSVITVNVLCADNSSTNLDYVSVHNGSSLFYGILANNTLLQNDTIPLDGLNSFTGACFDGLRNTTKTVSASFNVKVLSLWDEIENVDFDVSNLSSAIVYFDDNSSLFDFKNAGTNNVSYFSGSEEQLRFDLGYPDSVIVTRYIDVDLFQDVSRVKVCANKELVTHYTQLIISSVQRPIKLENIFSNCFVAADYTRFAYQDAYLLKAYTIAAPYNLNVFDVDVLTESILTGLDGSISSFYNVDTIEFKQGRYNLNILGETLTFNKESDTQMKIIYASLEGDKVSNVLTITRMDTGAIVSSVVPTDPNNFTVYFDWTALNTTDETLFLISTTSVDNEGGETITKRYMNTSGDIGSINAGLAFAISLLLVIFGLTLGISRQTFSWFGVFILLASTVVLSFAIKEWYIVFMAAIHFIVLVYVLILMTNKNYATVS